MLFAIDHGNYAIKTVNDSFIAGLAEYPSRPPLAEHVIEYGGKFYALTNTRIPYMRDKTRDDRYLVLTLFAIARELQSRGGVPPFFGVDLAVGLPPEHFSVLKDKFTAYFKRDGIRFAYNGKITCASFTHVFVYPQAYAAVVRQAQSMLDTPRMFIIDIGGYTTDVLLLCNGKPDLQFCRSLETGVITMNNEISGKVGALHDLKIEDDHIAAVIQGQGTILPKEAITTIREAVGSHADMILNKLRELQVDLRANPAVFIGGGSVLLKEYIEQSPMVVKADFVLDPKANAVGYGMLAAAQLQRIVNGG